MYACCRKWFDRARDIAEDFEYKDYFWCYLLVLLIGILFGISANKALKYLSPIIAIFAAFAAFEVIYPRRDKIAEIKGITPEEVERVTEENARRLFGKVK